MQKLNYKFYQNLKPKTLNPHMIKVKFLGFNSICEMILSKKSNNLALVVCLNDRLFKFTIQISRIFQILFSESGNFAEKCVITFQKILMTKTRKLELIRIYFLYNKTFLQFLEIKIQYGNSIAKIWLKFRNET